MKITRVVAQNTASIIQLPKTLDIIGLHAPLTSADFTFAVLDKCKDIPAANIALADVRARAEIALHSTAQHTINLPEWLRLTEAYIILWNAGVEAQMSLTLFVKSAQRMQRNSVLR